ncbi:MAG: hypothetical protein ABIC39_06180 [Pseudomonadota bacterium]
MSKFVVGITGHSGFIGTHLVERLSREQNIDILTLEDTCLKKEAVKADCIVYLSDNIKLAKALIANLDAAGRKNCHIICWSGAQEIFKAWGKRSGAPVSLLTVPCVYGDRDRPFSNSIVATFCYQLARGEEPKIIEDQELELIYINELTEIIYQKINLPPKGVERVTINGTKKITAFTLLSILQEFKAQFSSNRIIPALNETFLVNLYAVFLSYLDYDDLVFSPEVKADKRGELFELIKSTQSGQIFFSTSRPGVIRGDHYHTRKIERFCVLKGNASIRLRRVGTEEIKEYKISGVKPAFVEIPAFHAHHIENTGNDDLFTLFWCNELYNPANPDTYPEEVYQN